MNCRSNVVNTVAPVSLSWTSSGNESGYLSF